MMGVYYIQMDGLQTSLIISVTGETIIIEAVVSRAGRQAGRTGQPDPGSGCISCGCGRG